MTEIADIFFQGEEIRVVYLDGEVYFCASDICLIFMIQTPGNVHKKVPDEHKRCAFITDIDRVRTRKTVLVDKFGALQMIYRTHSNKAKMQDPHQVAEWVLSMEQEIKSRYT